MALARESDELSDELGGALDDEGAEKEGWGSGRVREAEAAVHNDKFQQSRF